MKIHYFQRYHQKENVETANTMLLLNRLYFYSPNKFYELLSRYFLPQNAEIKLEIELQKKAPQTIPDAIIYQPGFKIVVETKLNGDFNISQLKGHLEAFQNEKYKVLLTLDPRPMKKEIESKFQTILFDYNKENQTNVFHCNTTFEEIIKNVESVIDEHDYDMLEILQDYSDFCYADGLIPDAWKRMRVQLAGTTMEINQKLNLYYDTADKNVSDHEYFGLYSQKSVRAIGKITAVIVSSWKNDAWTYVAERGALTADIKNRIEAAREDAQKYGYDMTNTRYFIVEKFHETDFKKETPYAPMGTRIFDLTKVLGVEKLPTIEEIADRLKVVTWK